MIHLRIQCVRITLAMKRKLKIRIQNSKATKNLEIVTLFVLLLLCYSGSTSYATLTWKVFHFDDAQCKIYMKS